MTALVDQTIRLALAALLELADEAVLAPMPPSIQVKALLWLLYRHSDRTREPYARFWATMTEPGGDPLRPSGRGSYARTHWAGIARSVGACPERMGFEASLRDLARSARAEGEVRQLGRPGAGR